MTNQGLQRHGSSTGTELMTMAYGSMTVLKSFVTFSNIHGSPIHLATVVEVNRATKKKALIWTRKLSWNGSQKFSSIRARLWVNPILFVLQHTR